MKRLDRTRNTFRNLIFGLINKIVTLLLPFLIRSFIINFLGQEYLGLNNLFTSVLNVLNLAELGIGSAMVYSMYKPIAEENGDKICALLALYQKVYRIIGLVILAVGLSLLPFLKFLVNGGAGTINIHVLYLIFLMDTVLSYWLFAYKNSLLLAHQRTDVSSNIGSLIHILLNVVQIAMLVIFKNYYVFIIMKPIFTIANNLCINRVTCKMYPDYKPYGKITAEEKTAIFRSVKALMGHKIGATVVSSADSLVISSFLGLSILAVYSNYYCVIYAVIGFTALLFNGMLAGIGNSILVESDETNYTLFKNVNFISSWLVSWCSVCLLCLFQPFMTLWMGKDMLLSTSSLFLIVIYYFTWQLRTAGLFFKDAAGMWQADFWKPYVGAAVNLIVNIILVKLIGINGVFISTIICMAVIFFPWETYVLYRDLFKRSCLKYVLNQLYITIIMVIMCAATYYCCTLVHLEGIKLLSVRIIICLVLPNAIFIMLNFKRSEFKYVVGKAKKIFHR